jgi:hypothetical protein
MYSRVHYVDCHCAESRGSKNGLTYSNELSIQVPTEVCRRQGQTEPGKKLKNNSYDQS